MLRDIHLHGALGERFGRLYRLDIVSPIEAVRALGVMVPGFRAAIREGAYRIIRGARRKGVDLAEADLGMQLGRARSLHIVPVVAGRGGRGAGKAIAGFALAGLAFAFAPAAAAGGMSAIIGGTGGFLTFGQIAGIGLALGLSGVSQMLTKTPNTAADSTTNTSHLFSAPENVTTQGGCVPVAFGRVMVGSVVISSGLSAEEAGSGGTRTIEDLSTAEIQAFILYRKRPWGISDSEWARMWRELFH